MKVSHRFGVGSAVFDDDRLVSCAGLVPVMTLAEQTGLSRLIAEKVRIAEPRIASGAANPAPKLATVVAGMCAGADCIDDIDVVRSGGMNTLFDGVYAPSTVGTLLREFTFGHARQLESVVREHLVALCERTDLLPGADEQMFIDIDSLLRPVYGHAKQGASYGHTKIAGKQILRKGLSPLATTISTAGSAPVIAGLRLRAGRANSAKGAARMVAQAISTARAISAHTTILVRGDSAFGSRAVVGTCLRHGAQFSVAMARNSAIDKAIAAIGEHAWTPVRYPGAVRDPDTGAWISDAEVAEIPYTAFASTPDAITARLIVRRVKDARYRDALFPVWRYHYRLRKVRFNHGRDRHRNSRSGLRATAESHPTRRTSAKALTVSVRTPRCARSKAGRPRASTSTMTAPREWQAPARMGTAARRHRGREDRRGRRLGPGSRQPHDG